MRSAVAATSAVREQPLIAIKPAIPHISQALSSLDCGVGQCFFPVLYAQVGLYVKLIVAFAIIISRLEMFASKYALVPSFWDGFGMGLGFLVALLLIGALRELLGNGSLAGFRLTPGKPLLFFALPAGGFFSIALTHTAMMIV